jgi:hypothetical protein
MRGYPRPFAEGQVPSVTMRPAVARWLWYATIKAFGVLTSTARLQVTGAITMRLERCVGLGVGADFQQ